MNAFEVEKQELDSLSPTLRKDELAYSSHVFSLNAVGFVQNLFRPFVEVEIFQWMVRIPIQHVPRSSSLFQPRITKDTASRDISCVKVQLSRVEIDHCMSAMHKRPLNSDALQYFCFKTQIHT